MAKKICTSLKNKGVKLRAIVSSHNHEDHSNAIGPLVDGDKSIFRNDIEFFHQNKPKGSDFYNSMRDKIDDWKVFHLSLMILQFICFTFLTVFSKIIELHYKNILKINVDQFINPSKDIKKIIDIAKKVTP